jgi:hypothetical protein
MRKAYHCCLFRRPHLPSAAHPAHHRCPLTRRRAARLSVALCVESVNEQEAQLSIYIDMYIDIDIDIIYIYIWNIYTLCVLSL